MRLILLLVTLTLIAGCETFWVRSSTVPISNMEFPSCGYLALEQFSELKVMPTLTSESEIVGRSPYARFHIKKNEFGNIDVMFMDIGRNPLDSEISLLNNLLAKLTYAVTVSCNAS